MSTFWIVIIILFAGSATLFWSVRFYHIHYRYKIFQRKMKRGDTCMFFWGEERHYGTIQYVSDWGHVIVSDEFNVSYKVYKSEIYPI